MADFIKLKGVFLVFLMVLLIFGAVSCYEIPYDEWPYEGDTDLETIINVIKAEAQAANDESMAIIVKIFALDAHIINEKDGTEWHDPISHYVDLFEVFDFKNAINFDIKPYGEGIKEDTALMCSSNSGTYIMNGGKPETYRNVEVKDIWKLRKNKKGQWFITEYRYH